MHFSVLFSFSDPPPTGTYLVSGGEEGVLVLWQLDTHKREFRPRLGSPITHLACSPGDKYFTVGLQSNGETNSPLEILLLQIP